MIDSAHGTAASCTCLTQITSSFYALVIMGTLAHSTGLLQIGPEKVNGSFAGGLRRLGQLEQIALDAMEIIGILAIVGFKPTQLVDLLIDTSRSIPRIRMVREELYSLFSFGLRVDFFKELCQCAWVVAGVIQNLRPHYVGLCFICA